MRRTRLSAAIIVGMGTVLPSLVALSGPASAGTPGPNTLETVASGINVTRLPGATPLGSTPPDTPQTVSFVLRERNLGRLMQQVETGVKKYLSVSQFAASYGQTPANISALTSYLAHYGIKTTVYADDVDVVATGTVGEFDAALSVTQSQYRVPAFGGRHGLSGVPAQTVHGTAQSPRLPYRLSSFVLAILGLTNYAPYSSQSVHPGPSLVRPQASSSDSCLALVGVPDACHLPSDFAARYHLNGLYAKGANGSGQTLALINLATVDPGAPEYFWKNIAHVPDTGRHYTNVDIDGGAGAPDAKMGSTETDLDVEQAGAVAPGANIINYQAPDSDYGFADAFFAAASQNIASTVSASWVESEPWLLASIAGGIESAGYNPSFDEAFLEMAVQGQSGFISGGDAGAYSAIRDLSTTNLSVQSNSDSPFITATGGTTLPWSGTLVGPNGSAPVSVTAERAWGSDYLWPGAAITNGQPEATMAEALIIGGAGGFSPLYPTPLYQQAVPGTHTYHAVQYLTPTDYKPVQPGGLIEPTAWTFNPAPSVTSGHGEGRAVPDVSANADPFTGYLIYSPSLAQLGDAVLEGAWGGTSIVAPQLNGAAAVIDSYLGHRVGFWNPVIYAAAARPGSPFTQLNTTGTSNDNLFYTGNPGDPYNLAVGLGVPDLTALASTFARSR